MLSFMMGTVSLKIEHVIPRNRRKYLAIERLRRLGEESVFSIIRVLVLVLTMISNVVKS